MDTETFRWPETAARLDALWRTHRLRVSDDGRRLEEVADPPSLRVVLPPVLGPLPSGLDDRAARDRLPASPGRVEVALIRAGVSALGLWRDDELLEHKVFKRYVVRGTGRAQPLHLKTRGKSRYGSRLRLQGYRAQLEETIARVRAWRDEHGVPDRAFLSCPARLLGDLRRETPSFPEDPAPLRIPFDVRAPSFEELLRVRRMLDRGRIERFGELDPGRDDDAPSAGEDAGPGASGDS